MMSKLENMRRHAERLAAALDLVLHDAHPIYGSTALWHGGIGGQALTSHCAIINGAPPGEEWSEYDLPSKPLREFIQEHPFDLSGAKEELKHELKEML